MRPTQALNAARIVEVVQVVRSQYSLIMSRIRSNRVCFTVNNYTLRDLELCQLFAAQDGVTYFIAAQEIGENGTPHIQGFAHVNEDPKKCGLNYWKSRLPFSNAAHYSNAKGSDEANQAYCSKDDGGGPYISTGCPAPPETDVFAAIMSDCHTLSVGEILLKYPRFGLMYYSNIKNLVEQFQHPTMDAKLAKLRPWQDIVMDKLKNQSERKILFVVDIDGGKGKSVLTKHIFTSEDTWMCQGGKINDLMFAFVPAEYVIFDMARCNNTDYYPWNFMENLKNGWFTSTKYKGGMKVFKSPKIVVFMNEDPPRDKLSSDRYEIYNI